MNEQQVQGGCICKAVRYEVLTPPMFIHCCHCTWCQRETGTAFAVNALIESDCVKLLQGQIVRKKIPSASGRGQDVTKCASCGVTLWSNYSAAGEAVHFIRVGTLDNPEAFQPNIHIFTSTKQPWVRLPEDTPAVQEYYRRSMYWPAESIARYKTAIGHGRE